MSREIKFRAWSSKRNRYYKVRRIEFDLNGNATHVIVWEEDYLKFNIEHLIIEQYTGLKDINGKEIYKGDILYCTDINDYLTLSYKKGVLILEDINEEDYPLFYYLHDIEVVGNIQENKEDLK